ncbi:MAG: 50S ribosomal protein L24 [Candidatus Aminicenantes bacterium]|nr:50S ribosomal protein L24 [Candidatus Aminicenantes bacterium]
MAGLHVRKNDLVVIRQGKDRGKTGKVLKVDPATGRAVVERLNFIKHFVKPDRSKNIAGGIMEKEALVPVSRLMLYCEECGQGVRARRKRLEDKSKIRICPKCETVFETKK